MGFYDLTKPDRQKLVEKINGNMRSNLETKNVEAIVDHFSDEDTYIRKTGYQAIGKIYTEQENLRRPILEVLKNLLQSENEKVRQTAINAAGEIGMKDFEIVSRFFDNGLFDDHHSVRNAVIGSIKKMGAKNPIPVFKWAAEYLNHPDKEIRREICHGIELRGRTHPQDILPMLEKLQFDTTKRVRDTLIHVLGQIAYKKGCLQTVVAALRTWKNKKLAKEALDEIVDVHKRYENFAVLSQEEAITYIDQNFA